MSTFFRIAAPLAKQAVALVVFFSFVANWTNYFLPLVLLPLSKQQPVFIGLQHIIGARPHLRSHEVRRPGRVAVDAAAGAGHDDHHHPAVHPVHRCAALPHARRGGGRREGLTRSGRLGRIDRGCT